MRTNQAKTALLHGVGGFHVVDAIPLCLNISIYTSYDMYVDIFVRHVYSSIAQARTVLLFHSRDS